MTGTIRVRLPSLRSTSTARPRLTFSRRSAYGLPSRRSKPVFITGDSEPATMMAQAIMCVNESFWLRPAAARSALIWRRWASRVATDKVRKLVAVGTLSDSSMYWASTAFGPLSS